MERRHVLAVAVLLLVMNLSMPPWIFRYANSPVSVELGYHSILSRPAPPPGNEDVMVLAGNGRTMTPSGSKYPALGSVEINWSTLAIQTVVLMILGAAGFALARKGGG